MSTDSSVEYDVAVVGAGPAGTSAAIHLALAGARVVLLEARAFPRHKLCGEFISPECAPHFRHLGVEAQMCAASPARITETIFYTQRGRRVHVPSAWFGGDGEAAMGLSRSEMDARLLARACAVGVDVRETEQATGVLMTAKRTVCGVRFKRADGARDAVRAGVTLDATGRARVLARAAQAQQAMPDDEPADDGAERASLSSHRGRIVRERAQLVAFKAHFTGVRGLDAACCEIYFYRGGYGGLNNVEGRASNLCFMVRAEDVRRCGSDVERVLREVVFRNPRARRMLVEARPVTKWLSVALESFGRGTLAPAPGLLAIGDAASFIDPFTGSGMLMALESGAVAAQTVSAWLASTATTSKTNDGASLRNLGADYAAGYDACFSRRLRICSYLRRAAFAPSPVIEAVAAALNVNDGARRVIARATRKAK